MMDSKQTSHIANHEAHILPEGSVSTISNSATLIHSLKDSDQDFTGLDDGSKSANVEAVSANQTTTKLVPPSGEETVSSTSTVPAVAPVEQLELDDDIPTSLQYDSQSEFGHISVG